jgi:serine/threonine protein phosphatase PrpC
MSFSQKHLKKTMQDFSHHKEFSSGIKVSAAATKGNVRKQMEDKLDIADFVIDDRHFHAFAVFDGHCGTLRNPETSTVGYVANRFLSYLQDRLRSTPNVRKAIDEVFLLLAHETKNKASGTTASLLLVIVSPNAEREIWVANVGDSSIFGFRREASGGCKIQKLSRDHKPNLKSELSRLSAQPGFHKIEDNYVVNRKGDQLGMSRALGDSDFVDIISSRPTITRLGSAWDCYVCASDGVFDVMSGRDVWERLKIGDWQTSAKDLLEYRNQTFLQHDNSICQIVFM